MRKILTCLTLSLVLLSGAAFAKECPAFGWNGFLDPGPQTYEVVERIHAGESTIVVIKFDELTGEYAKVYLFFEFLGECPRRAVSLGSYATTNLFAADGERVYHLDLYEVGSHTTLDFFSEIPPFEEINERALEVLKP